MAGNLPHHARNLGLAPPAHPPMLSAASGAKPVRFLVRRAAPARPVGSIGTGSAFGQTLGDDRLPTTPAVDPAGTADTACRLPRRAHPSPRAIVECDMPARKTRPPKPPPPPAA